MQINWSTFPSCFSKRKIALLASVTQICFYFLLQIGNVEVKEDGKLELTFHSPYLSIFGSRGIVGRSIVIHEKPIEYRRFPDIYGTPVFPTLNMNQYQSEEQQTGAILACGIITVTSNLAPVVPPPNNGGMQM